MINKSEFHRMSEKARSPDDWGFWRALVESTLLFQYLNLNANVFLGVYTMLIVKRALTAP
jgi:hypothetical protein